MNHGRTPEGNTITFTVDRSPIRKNAPCQTGKCDGLIELNWDFLSLKL
jgi:hypothetical protein